MHHDCFLNAPHKICSPALKISQLQNSSPPTIFTFTAPHIWYDISHIIPNVATFTDTHSHLSPPQTPPPSLHLSASGSQVFGSWYLARFEKGVASLSSDRLGFQTDASAGPGARWDLSGTTGAPAKSLVCLPKEAECVRTVGGVAATPAYI